jgi:hypothetical protein
MDNHFQEEPNEGDVESAGAVFCVRPHRVSLIQLMASPFQASSSFDLFTIYLYKPI